MTRRVWISGQHETAKIIRNKNDKYVCGLGNKGTPEHNWEIIREILNEI